MALRGRREFQYTNSGSNEPNRITEEFFEVRKMMYGAPRRANLMKLFKQGLEFYVNKKHCIQINEDTDIKYLLKKEKIELVNETQANKCKHTFVRLKR